MADHYPQHMALIPYATMLKEQSKKWKSDERKVMNWMYDEEEDSYTNPTGIRFLFSCLLYPNGQGGPRERL
ncbi:hypothetical protein ACWOE0_01595 [Enterococcus caccae]